MISIKLNSENQSALGLSYVSKVMRNDIWCNKRNFFYYDAAITSVRKTSAQNCLSFITFEELYVFIILLLSRLSSTTER